ncbi:hypothetical protein OG453_27185 [Streptomyces sp. NBC_01381]|uniref:hypothetical protein n=1 Tax=Streptomyces sp. NBC_01381 TaxID=2903845 RepID=UPI00225B9C0E|nr:hypothetical protein [Streptomyces sp. NBC_01381]MCX4670332.1 hypothetical protein [Streptomyces sp. NBC_01381]
MNSAVIALVVAVCGVMGTLLAPVLSQGSQARALEADFERHQQADRTQWRREQEREGLEQRRTCYVDTNAAFRRYRVQLMNFLYFVHRGQVTEEASQELEAARQAHHTAFAEAQMIASASVLSYLDELAIALGQSYRRTKNLEEGHPESDGSFEEIEVYLNWLWERWDAMRGAMRADLGISDAPRTPPSGNSP